MKYLLLLIFSFSSFGSCEISLLRDEINYIGYNLNIAGASSTLVLDKGFDIVYDNNYKYLLDISAKEVIGNRFNKAEAKMSIYKEGREFYKLIVHKTCFTMSCSVSTVANTLNKLFVKAKKKLRNCH